MSGCMCVCLDENYSFETVKAGGNGYDIINKNTGNKII